MSGVAVIRSLLAANGAMTAIVPALRIKAGLLPLNTGFPAIAVTSISSVRRNTVAMIELKTLVTERVQVSFLDHENEYPGMVTAMRLIRQACPNQSGTVAGVELDSITPDTEGPDIESDVAGILSRSQDFMVRWLEAR